MASSWTNPNTDGSDTSVNGSNSSSYPVLLDEIFNNLTNREEILRRWSEKLRLEREEAEKLVLAGFESNSTDAGAGAGADVTEMSFLPNSIWPLLWIALYVMVLILIIVVTVKACILLFEKTDESKFEDDMKDSPNILRLAVAGRGRLSTPRCSNSLPIPVVPIAVLEHQRSISPRSVILQQPSPNPTRPCYIYNGGAGPYAVCTGAGLATSGGTASSTGTGNGSCSWSHNFMGMGAVAGCCHKTTAHRRLRTSGRGVSLESELMMTPCGNYYLHHNIHNQATVKVVPPHHHSQQQLCTMSVTPPTTAIPGCSGAGAVAVAGVSPSGSRNQKQYQYQHQHTNDSSLQWDSLNTTATDHSGESPPSYEIALGVENASRPNSGTGNRSDREGET